MPERKEYDLNTPAAEENTKTGGTPAPKKKYSGAYWYVPSDAETLAKNGTIRTLLTIIAFMLQVVILVMPQGGLEYVTLHLPSYAFIYMWLVFIYIGVSIYIFIMNAVRYKFVKRIPVERAPKNGFKNRAFFGTELFMGMNALMLAVEISFVCISYDGFGLLGVFVAAAALAASVIARQYTIYTLKGAELIPAPDAATEAAIDAENAEIAQDASADETQDGKDSAEDAIDAEPSENNADGGAAE